MRLLGRDDELAALEAFLAAGDAPSIMLVCGERGLGKTSLWQQAVSRATGLRLLAARPTAADHRLPYAGIADLFGDVDADDLASLPPPQRDALLAALARANGIAEPRLMAAAVLSTLRRLAAGERLLIAVDDLPALDRASAAALVFALRRLDPGAFRMLATARTGWAGELPALPTDALGPAGIAVLRPPGLPEADIAQLLADRVGSRPRRVVLEWITAAADGNPWLALELAADPTTVPANVGRALPRVPRELHDVLLLTALAHGELEAVLAAAPDASGARAALDDAEAAGLIRIVSPQVRFVPPATGLAVAARAPAGARREVHRRLAAVTTGSTAARHVALAAAAPDEESARALDAAAASAAAAQNFDAAAELAELAVSLTPAGDGDTRRQRLVAAAERWFEAGDIFGSRQLLEQALQTGRRWSGRAAALNLLAKYQRYAGEPLNVWSATLRAALAALPDLAVDLEMDLLIQLGMAACNAGSADDVPAYADRMAALATAHPEVVDAQVAAAVAYVHFLSGRGVRHDLVDRALVPEDGLARLPVEVRPTYMVAVLLAHAGELDAARSVLDAEYATADQVRDDVGLPILAWLLVLVEISSGRWQRAAELAEYGRQAAERADLDAGRGLVAGATARLHACRGDVQAARTEAARAIELGERTGLVPVVLLGTVALAALELARGDPAAADRATARLPEPTFGMGSREPGFAWVIPDRIESLIRVGKLDEADVLLRPFLATARSVERRWALVTGGRCEALLLSARGDLAAAEQALDDALERASGLGQPLELARTYLISGEVRRRARRKQLAREHLLAAQAIFERLGARLWVSRCAVELGRIAGRVGPHPDTPLTSTELRVAALAAEGHTSREIAGVLFAGIRTVESHLQQVYRKLGVRSRVELSRHLAHLDDAAANIADFTDSSGTAP